MLDIYQIEVTTFCRYLNTCKNREYLYFNQGDLTNLAVTFMVKTLSQNRMYYVPEILSLKEPSH